MKRHTVHQVHIVHRVYGPRADKTACGLVVKPNTATARPGPNVTCKNCKWIESRRRIQARERKARIAS